MQFGQSHRGGDHLPGKTALQGTGNAGKLRIALGEVFGAVQLFQKDFGASRLAGRVQQVLVSARKTLCLHMFDGVKRLRQNGLIDHLLAKRDHPGDRVPYLG
jgi:hypothetical protein